MHTWQGWSQWLTVSPVYCIYSHVSRKIYNKFLPEKYVGDLSPGHKMRIICSAAKIHNFRRTHVTNNDAAEDEFGGNDARQRQRLRIMLTFCIQHKSS